MAPTATTTYLVKQYRVRAIGSIGDVKEQLYALTTERQLQHPAIIALNKAAREDLFGHDDGTARRPVRRPSSGRKAGGGAPGGA